MPYFVCDDCGMKHRVRFDESQIFRDADSTLYTCAYMSCSECSKADALHLRRPIVWTKKSDKDEWSYPMTQDCELSDFAVVDETAVNAMCLATGCKCRIHQTIFPDDDVTALPRTGAAWLWPILRKFRWALCHVPLLARWLGPARFFRLHDEKACFVICNGCRALSIARAIIKIV